MLTKRTVLILALLLFVVFIGIRMLWQPSEKVGNMILEDEVVEVEESLVLSADATPSDHEYQKAHNFISHRITVKDIFLEFSLDEEDEHVKVTFEDKRKGFFDTFYAAVKVHDMDLFLSTVSSESISEVWDGELDIEKRIGALERVLTNLSKEDTLEAIQYQFEKGDDYTPATSGVMYFVYDDGKRITVPFQLSGTTAERYYGDSHNHDSYTLVTSLLEMERIILEKQ